MSQLSSGNDLTFVLRADRNQLSSDLKSAEREVIEGARRIATSASRTISGHPFKMELDTTATGDAVDREIGKILLKVREDVKRNKLQLDIETRLGVTGDPNKEARDRFAGTKGAGAGGAESAGLLDNLHKVQQSVARVAKTFIVIEGATAAVNVGLAATDLISASISGNYEDQVKSAKSAEDAIKGLPIVGERILSIGKLINKYTIDLVTGEQAYVEKVKEAVVAQEAKTKLMAAQVELGKKNIAQAEQIAKNIGVGATETAEQKISRERKALDDSLKGAGLRDKGGKLTATGKALQAEGNTRLNRAADQEIDARNEAAFKANAEVAANALQSQDKVAEAERVKFAETQRQKIAAATKLGPMQRQQQEAINASELKLFDQQSARKRQQVVDDLNFQTEQNKRREQRDKFGGDQAAIKKQFNDQLKHETDPVKREAIIKARESALAVGSAEEKRRITETTLASEAKMREDNLRAQGRTYEADVSAFEAAADAKIRAASTQADKELAINEKKSGVATMQARRTKETSDVQFQADQMRLERTGKGGSKGDARSILRQTGEEIKAAMGDEARKAAIVSRAEEQIRAIRPSQQNAEVISGSSALRANLLGGSPGRDRLTAVQEEALNVLRQIRDRGGAVGTI